MYKAHIWALKKIKHFNLIWELKDSQKIITVMKIWTPSHHWIHLVPCITLVHALKHFLLVQRGHELVTWKYGCTIFLMWKLSVVTYARQLLTFKIIKDSVQQNTHFFSVCFLKHTHIHTSQPTKLEFFHDSHILLFKGS